VVRSQFGYHVIQVTERRTNALEQADQLVTRLKEDPDSFAEVAEAESEDVSSAQDGGDLGWIIHYQYEAARDEAIFAMTEPDEISDPVVTGAGIYIYKLLNSADQRFVPQHQRDQVSTSGFNRWLDEMRDEAGVWLDSEFTATSAGGAG
jgi:parvulin-like peptidyl-prolyl isomerase